jgi:hypothetical protein
MSNKHTVKEEIPGCLKPVLRFHAGNRLEREIPLKDSEPAETGNSVWQCQMVHTPVAGHPGTHDIEVTFRITDGEEENVSVGLAFGFADWTEENYLLLPSAVYRGNNFKVWDIPYPPMWRDAAQFRLDMPTTITPAPRLGGDSHRIEQTTGDTASPTMGFHSPSQGMGFLVQTTQGTRLGNNGLMVETTEGHTNARFLVTAPSVREFRQDHCKAVPSEDRGASWEAGDSLTLRARIWLFESEELQGLFEHYCELRKDLNDSESVEVLPFSAAWKIVEAKYNRDNWVEKSGYYKLAPNAHTTFEQASDPLCFLWQLGWVGGGMMTLPMLAEGDEITQRRAWMNLEMIFDRTQAPSGFFLGIGDGENFYGDGFDRPLPLNVHMVRKSGDWLYFAIQQLELLSRQGRKIPAAWEIAIRGLADAFVKLWERFGQFGQYVDVETGGLLIGGSSAAAVVPGALVLAYERFGDSRYLDVAEASARRFHQDILSTGITTGGPGEILSAPDSESAFAMLESFVKLLELTGRDEWKQASLAMLRQAATWVVSYDFVFPAESSLGHHGIRTSGAVFANTQNKHAAPGICTWSGDSLFRLWRATGDPLALDLIRDIAHGITQYVSREDRQLSEAMQPGWMCERVNLSDWETPSGVGNQLFGSCSWVETALMLTYFQIPGLYVQPDTGFVCAFDHIVVESKKKTASGLQLMLHNPTSFDAEVKVLCEDQKSRSEPLGLNPLLGARTILIPAGKTVCAEF